MLCTAYAASYGLRRVRRPLHERLRPRNGRKGHVRRAPDARGRRRPTDQHLRRRAAGTRLPLRRRRHRPHCSARPTTVSPDRSRSGRASRPRCSRSATSRRPRSACPSTRRTSRHRRGRCVQFGSTSRRHGRSGTRRRSSCETVSFGPGTPCNRSWSSQPAPAVDEHDGAGSGLRSRRRFCGPLRVRRAAMRNLISARSASSSPRTAKPDPRLGARRAAGDGPRAVARGPRRRRRE